MPGAGFRSACEEVSGSPQEYLRTALQLFSEEEGIACKPGIEGARGLNSSTSIRVKTLITPTGSHLEMIMGVIKIMIIGALFKIQPSTQCGYAPVDERFSPNHPGPAAQGFCQVGMWLNA